MNYKVKAKLQKIISSLPKSEAINYFFQKYVTKTLPIPIEEFKVKLNTVEAHLNNFKEFGNKAIENSVYYEIGAGYDMVIPMSMSVQGFKKLICIDVRILTFMDVLNDSIKKIQLLNNPLVKFSEKQLKVVFTKNNFLTEFKNSFNILYMAPADARKTGLDDNSIDYVLTNAVLEHIPAQILSDIMKETFRIMKPGGVMSNIIDYRDHYAYSDNQINFYNYLTLSKEQWKMLNPDIMHQNRLRHRDYSEAALKAGFEIVKEDVTLPDKVLSDLFSKMKISYEFKNKYSDEELKILGSQLVLRKP